MSYYKLFFTFCLAFFSFVLFSQDVIVKKDGELITCKVAEIAKTTIKYRDYANLDGPLYNIDKREVLTINFENGKVEVITTKNNSGKRHKSSSDSGSGSEIYSIGYTGIADVNFSEVISGIEFSSEFLFNNEKIGLRLPLYFYFNDGVYTGGGTNLKFYLNKGVVRGFIGPEIMGVYDFSYGDGFFQVMGDIGLSINPGIMNITLHGGAGYGFSAGSVINIGLTVGVKF